MSPEQVEGKELDERSDIFSLGAVLYEMVTGKRAFEGKSQLSVASAILEKEPEAISAVRPLTPQTLDHAIRRCLAKDPEERWQTARDLELELKWMSGGGSQAGFAAAPIGEVSPRLWKAWTVASVLGVATIALGVVLGWKTFHSKSPARDMPVVRFDIPLTTADSSAFSFLTLDRGVAIAPDGSRVENARSEEHTSELQSRLHLVCRLLLGTKKPD